MLKINEITQLYLGIQGENRSREIRIDVSDWMVSHPNGSFSVWITRPGETIPQATGATFDADEGVIIWQPTSTDTYVAGEGEAEIRMTEGSVIKKTKRIRIGISGAVTGGGSVLGSDWQSYIDEVDRIKSLAVAASNTSVAASETAVQAKDDALEAQAEAEAARDAAEEARDAAQDAQTAAERSALDAQTAQTAAAGSAQAAQTARAGAETAQNASEAAAGNAAQSATGAAAYASNAQESAYKAAQDAERADQAARDARSGRQDIADDLAAARAAIATDKSNAESAIQAKGEQTIESIPEDYTNLSNQVSDLNAAINTGYKIIEADWARGTLVNGEYSGSNYKRVATVTPVMLQKGDLITVTNGYKYLLNYKTENSHSDLGWFTTPYEINLTGNYLICVTSDPEPTDNITDISLYTSKLLCTSNDQRQIDIICDFIKNYVEPNWEAGKNLFNRDTAKQGYLVARNSGILTVNNSNCASDYIRVYSGETIYKKNCSNWYSVLYDLNYQYVEALENSNNVTISQDGYIRVTVTNTNLTTAIISRTSTLPDASDYKASFIDRVARKEIIEMSTWSNTIETLVSQLEIRDSSYHAAGSVDISEYAFVSIRVGNSLGVPCTMNFYDDRIPTSTTWMSRPDGSYVSVNVPAGSCIITADDLKELPYFKYLRPIITPASAPESGVITIQIVGRK